ncbi:hypothetical protein ColTof4_00424 [Colletotrichum tofieldiae]|nr:hypothetical protein ColTof3_07629 [Colletotrichum tofieldiae]GKT68001.1 hypothetical protein ColTof4_00424 [Colletotrichum tofieldiae]
MFASWCSRSKHPVPRDADILRNCREVNGNVVVALIETANIDLSGPEVIHGNLSGTEQYMSKGTSLNISSTTLTTVDGHLSISGYGNPAIQNISFPRLNTVGGTFSLWNLGNLVYVDITNLHTVGAFDIWAWRLSTLKHKELRKIAPAPWNREGIRISETSLESVDSIFNNNIKVGHASLYGSSALKRVVVGFNESASLILSGSPETKQLEVVLGGESTTSMHIGLISLSGDVASFQRSSSLQKLTADSFQSYENHYKHLHLPFDQLSSLELYRDESLEWISIPPQATRWANFSLRIDHTKANLSSEYMIDEKGELVRSWYWPQRDMFRINIGSGNMTLAFL